MTATNLPPSLNSIAAAWRKFFEKIPFTLTKDLDVHIEGTHSVYVQEIILRRKTGDLTMYYVGQSADPASRANKHKHELQRCRTTTFIGKSTLFSPEIMTGLKAVDMHMSVQISGLSLYEAKIQEKMLAAVLAEEHGTAVLTRPCGAKKSLSHPRSDYRAC